MARIPLIVGFGGVNAAGRGSFHHAYKRMVIDQLSDAEADKTYQSLAVLMQIEAAGGVLSAEQKQYMLDHTLIRRIEEPWFDVENVSFNKKVPLSSVDEQPASFTTRKRNLPESLPADWQVTELEGGNVRIDIRGKSDFLLPSHRVSPVQSAGQLPTGFNPGKLYASRSHPRGLQMTVYGASDAVNSMGIDWQTVSNHVSPDLISVYAGSAMAQLDPDGNGGMMSARLGGGRVTSKNLALGLPEMPADFINAYVLGSLGNTGSNTGACATFLYNLRQAVADIQAGRARVAVVGSSEAPITPDVIDGYAAMGALATDKELLELDAHLGLSEANHRRACRPFSNNCGFTIAESSQYIVLFDDELAMELGASVHGAVTDVFVNADGHKKSISSPGIGNYVTVAKSLAVARSILGDESVQQRSFVQAHGTSTPQNRVTESHILNEAAKAFGIENWHVSAIKAYLGHSIGVSSGDQMNNTLGIWAHGIIPGIHTIEGIADDVCSSHLNFSSEHVEVGRGSMDVAILNAKGFGGNNASAPVLAPHIAERMLAKKYGADAFAAYQQRNEAVREKAQAYDAAACQGKVDPIYKFDHNVLGGDDLELSTESLKVSGYEKAIDLTVKSPYADML